MRVTNNEGRPHATTDPEVASQRICKAAGVPRVTAHGMRGLHGTLAVDSGITSHAGAAALGHEFVQDDGCPLREARGVAGAQQKRALAVLIDGRLAS